MTKERLSPCAGAPDAPLLDEEDAASRVGQRVAVRGRLEHGAMGVSTMMACVPPNCCNHVHSTMQVDRWLPLHDLSRPDRFACDGDESMVCCYLENAREGIAVGKLVAQPLVGGRVPGYVLEVESLCRVR